MANIVNFSTYGFLNDILALTEENWRRFFKPFVYDSVQSGLQVTAGTGMKVNISPGECRCGAVMGISNSSVSLDVTAGNNTNPRIDSIVIQYQYGTESVLSMTVVEGTPSINPVAPALTKNFNSIWQMEIAEILVPANAIAASQCTITDTRVICDSVNAVINNILYHFGLTYYNNGVYVNPN